MEERNFDWLAVRVLSPDWLSRKLQECKFCQAPGGQECGPCPDFAAYTLALAVKLTKITEKLVRVTEGRYANQRRKRFF